MKQSLIALSLATVLVACGGGGGSKTTTPAPTTPTTPTTPPATTVDATIVQAEETVLVGQSTELILLAPDNRISDITWSQTAGAALTFYASNSKVIGFTPTSAGDYSFEVSFNQDNEQQTLDVSFTVEASQAALTARLGHAVVEGNAVSLISYANIDGLDQSSLTWNQTDGPVVTYTGETSGEVAVFFDAPNVTEDTVLSFTVSGSLNGETVTDDVSILVENSTISLGESGYVPFDERIANVFLYNQDSPAGQKLVDCVYSNKASYALSCNFNESPLIAHISETPTVDDIMDRVIVSHKWMGDQFKEFLERYDNEHHDFKNLLRATTAIVISYDIRPSFYHPYTGAIYLDPSDLWVNPDQRDTINQAPDFRAAFGNDLQFEMPWRYIKDNDYASGYYRLSSRASRDLEDSLYDFASLLYHELAHSNDYFPSTSWDNLKGSSTTFLTLINDLFTSQQIVSDDLQRFMPLDENWADGGQNEMTQLGQVRFQGQDANDTQKAYTPEDVANMFETEGAPQFYSYSSTREDFAILFDAFMMKARYGIDRDVAVSDQEYDVIAWGQRGREGATQIKPRVQFVTERVLPTFTEAASVIANLPEPTPLDTTKSWYESRVITDGSAVSSNSLAKKLAEKSKLRDPNFIPKDGLIRHGQGRPFIY